MKIKFENAEGIKDGIHEVKITKIKRVKLGKDKKSATQVTFVGKTLNMTSNFFDNYISGQLFQSMVRAVGFEDFDVTVDEIDSEDLIGESLNVEVAPQEGNPKFKEIKDYLPIGDEDDLEDDDEEEDEDEEEEEDEE
nr:MAG TPA: Rio2 kinase kinase, ADP complex, phosphoaspartate [Bacteriophage sp.]